MTQTQKEKITLFDDGSIYCKVLEKELELKNQYEIVKLKASSLTEFFEKCPKPKDKDDYPKVFLPIPLEDTHKTEHQNKINQMVTKFPNLRIVDALNGRNKFKIEAKARVLGIEPSLKDNDKDKEIVKEKEVKK